MRLLFKIYQRLNWLSLDVVAGAVCSALFFAQLLSVTIRPQGLLALAFSVWLIYTIDHLRDAKQAGHAPRSPRYAFHLKHFRLIASVAVIVFLLDAILVFFIRPQVFFGGIAMAALVVTYLAFHRRFPFLKELMIAVLYTCGVLLPSATVTKVIFSEFHILVVFCFFMIVVGNLLLVCAIDFENDQHDKQISFAVRFGKPLTMIIVRVVLLTAMLMSLWLLFQNPCAGAILLLMTVIHVTILMSNDHFRENERYRLMGEVAFLLPGIYLLCPF